MPTRLLQRQRTHWRPQVVMGKAVAPVLAKAFPVKSARRANMTVMGMQGLPGLDAFRKQGKVIEAGKGVLKNAD